MKQVKAAFAFTARSDTEISFDVGDVIFVLSEDPSGWGKGRTKEYKEGYFPLAYVQIEDLSDSDDDDDEVVQVAQTQSIKCTALYDFSALSELQLSFSKGDVIAITKKGSDNEWWEGTLERTNQKGLFPSNYVKIGDQNDTQIVQPSEPRTESGKQQANNFKEHVPTATTITQEPQYKISEQVDSTQHKKTEGASNFRVEDSFETDSGPIFAVDQSFPKPKSLNTSVQFSSNLSPLNVSVPFELHTGNYHREFATLSPISPNLSTLAYDSVEMARRRHSMNISAASPIALSALGGENTRDFDALCLLYPFVPSSVSHNAPSSQPLITPTKFLANVQPTFVSPPADIPTQPTSQPIPIPFPHQIPQSRPQSAPQIITPRQSTSIRQATPSQPAPSNQASTQPSSTPPKPVVPKLSLTASPDRKEGYSNRDQRERNSASAGAGANASAAAGASTQAAASTNGSGAKTPGRAPSKYGAIKSPGARRDASSGAGASKRKVKLEASFSLGKKPNSTITHSNSTPEQAQDANQVASGAKDDKQQLQPQHSEVEHLKKILQQEVELRAHLESVVHDAHGKMHSASQYIKDLKAELFQAHMDISQLRVTNRQLNEQLDKFQLVTRVSVTTQTERDENIDKIRTLTEHIHELEASTESLNEQIATLKNRSVDRSPRNMDRSPRNMDRSPRGDRSGNHSYSEMGGEVRVDYDAVKQQFARVRECLLLEKDIKDRLLVEKTQAQEKLQKTEQQGKQIRRKLLTELQLKSDLNVRNQHIELQMQKLKEELATYKHLATSSN